MKTTSQESSGDCLSHSESVALVRRMRHGDEAAAHKLVQLHQSDLRRYLRHALRGKPQIDPEDVHQEVWIYVLRKLDVYDEVHAFRQFLFGLAGTIVKRAMARKDREVSFDGTYSFLERAAQQPVSKKRASRDGPQISEDYLRVVSDCFPEVDPPEDPAVFSELLELMCRCGGHPHQVLGFSYSVVLYGEPKKPKRSARSALARKYAKVPVTGRPGRVVQEHAKSSLRDLASELLRFLSESPDRDHEDGEFCCAPLVRRLDLSCRDLFSLDPISTEQFSRFLELQVGESLLNHYVGRDPVKSIADWTNVVKMHIRRRLAGQEICRRCVYRCASNPREQDAGAVTRGRGRQGRDGYTEMRP